eukprot:CAMPEP_0177325310 /NCGR_PEP_ID=MMETSP0368-20130122/17734_1 /TAXON_ID=447022 ORGANISM="Scrippsiella hangoei-like, Strain SHHI-4" /NCGR_SAMPLE_ID=MMETSP0368 /ASSEMBLY_ACC=CAM_ASM_000363 /LENGTH=63 /DNA_ID=CAMNT_0018785187 /DNA_START=1 /DNA_END=192 /DNA_ORIENTATION=-
MAKIGASGRYLANMSAVEPVSVRAMINVALQSIAAFTADAQTASTEARPAAEAKAEDCVYKDL